MSERSSSHFGQLIPSSQLSMNADDVIASHSEKVIFQLRLCLASSHNGLTSYVMLRFGFECLITDFGVGEGSLSGDFLSSQPRLIKETPSGFSSLCFL